jgi:hypothetical protein
VTAAAESSAEEADAEGGAVPQSQTLRRLSLTWSSPDSPAPITADTRRGDGSVSTVAFDWAHATAAAIGSIAHRLFAQIASEGLAAWALYPDRIAGERGRIVAELAGEGVPPAEREDAARYVAAAVTRTLADARGRWLFDPAHGEAQSEWALAGLDSDTLRHISIDRTFIADGVRWIVDFKTGRHEGSDKDAFLDREADRYRDQLDGYARIVRELDARPIRLALYFPLVDGGWRDWPHCGVPAPTGSSGGVREN